MDKLIRAHVEIAFIGESPAVKHDGAVLVKAMNEIEVEALPGDLPHTLEADLSKLLRFEDKILVKDLAVPNGVRIITHEDEVIAISAAQNAEEDSIAPEGGITDVKTEREVKLAEQSKDEESEDE
jgi:large subunit ribosomal protein L25